MSGRRDGRAPLRVVHVGFDAGIHNVEPAQLLDSWPTLTAVAAACARAGVRVDVVQAADRDELIERNGVMFHFVREATRAPRRVAGIPIPRNPRRVIRLVQSLAPDVVHVNGLNNPMAVRHLIGATRGTPVLVQDHGTIEPRGWRRVAWRWAYAPVDAVAFTAKEQARPFVEAGVLSDAVRVFEILESSSTFRPGDRDASRATMGMSGDPCMLWTGRLDTNKDPLSALDAFEVAAAELPAARLYCCFGAAPLLDDVKQRVANSSLLSERVTLVGRRPRAEMEHWFRGADFFVQASHREGSGYSLIEALACGTTPLVTDIPPFRRMVGSAGSVSPVGDSRALGEAMVSWSARDRDSLRIAARTRFDQALTFDVIGRDLHAAYEQLAAKK
jgi:glycosyltransferase involved in cell wall biosynthesis